MLEKRIAGQQNAGALPAKSPSQTSFPVLITGGIAIPSVCVTDSDAVED
jgi:hypothetical protein